MCQQFLAGFRQCVSKGSVEAFEGFVALLKTVLSGLVDTWGPTKTSKNLQKKHV